MALHRGFSEQATPEEPGRSSNAMVTEANPAFGTRLSPPKARFADEPVPPEIAYELIHQELLLDGSARLNLATFVTTWMEPQARRLMSDCVDKNMIDKDEYPQTVGERGCSHRRMPIAAADKGWLGLRDLVQILGGGLSAL